LAGEGFRVRIYQKLVRIESQALGRLKRAVDAVPIQLSRLEPLDVAVPHIGGAFRETDSSGLWRVGLIEETQLH